MASTVSQIAARVRKRVRDDTLSDSDLIELINDAQNAILNRYSLPNKEKKVIDVLTIGVPTYELKVDTHSVIDLIITDPDNPKDAMNITGDGYYLEYREFNRRYPAAKENPQARPFTWTLAPGGPNTARQQIYFTSPVDKQYIMQMIYLQKPVQLTQGAQEPFINDEFVEILVLGAASRVFDIKDKYDMSQELLNKQEHLLVDMTKRLNQRHRGVSGKVRIPQLRKVHWG